MQSLASKLDIRRFKEPTESKINNSRQYWVGKFLDTLNLYLKLTYKPLKASMWGKMLRFVKTENLGQFYAECKDANHFAKYFWSRYKK